MSDLNLSTLSPLTSTPSDPKPQCQHVMDEGRLCRTPPLKGQPFCYYHTRLHATFILPGHPAYVPPVLENPHSVQIALNHLYLALAKNLIDRRLASSLLYSLQLVQNNMKSHVPAPAPAYSNPATEIPASMRDVLGLDENGTDLYIATAPDDAPLSTDSGARNPQVRMGANIACPIELPHDSNHALRLSNQLATKSFSRSEVPAYVPELELSEWLRITRDLPPKGEAGTASQQLNCRRVLQILNYHDMRRRMHGLKETS